MPSGERLPASYAAARVDKAEQFIRSAAGALERDDWDAAISAAVLAGIASCDAYLAGRHGLRSSGHHHEAAMLLRKHGGPGVAKRSEQLRRLLSVKSEAQYGERMFGAKQARECVTRAEHLVSWAKDALKGER